MKKITIRETDRFIEIYADNGYVLTNWNKDNILDYTSTKMLVCPLNYDYSGFYTISDEDDAKYMELQRIEIEKINS